MPGSKMMRPLTASNARKSSPSLAESTTAETVATSTATTAPATSWRYPPTLGPYGFVTSATRSCCREAPPRAPDTTHNLSNHEHYSPSL